MAAKVEFYRHSVGEEERQAVVEAMRGPFLTTGNETLPEVVLASLLQNKVLEKT
jgi:hypothetical protein